MLLKKQNYNSGFTLVEVMIAITLFTAIMIIGTGAVLQTNAVHKKTQTMRSIMDNLNFIMEDMARNLRLGYSYECNAAVPTSPTVITPTPTDCVNGGSSLAFISADGTPFVYAIGSVSGSPVSVFKSKNGEAVIKLNPDEVVINPRSGFNVYGTEIGGNQPRVVIRLSGTITAKNVSTDFDLETTVSQRLLDI